MPASLPAFTFGAELELYLPDGVSHVEAARRITEAGVTCRAENYNHDTRPVWKIVTDGSLGDYRRGAEIVSPVLRGEEGLTQLATVCRALTEMGCEIKRTCGFHVHVGIGREDVQTIRNLYTLYGHYEPVIDSFMPRSRRAQTVGYCKMIRNRAASAAQASDLDDLARRMGRDRYYTLNIESYFRHSTVEFRQHSGTVDAQKATAWVRVCLGMVQAAKELVAPAPVVHADGWRNPYPVGSVNHLTVEALIQPSGATSGQIAAIHGRSSGFNVSAIARGAGMTVQLARSSNWRNNRFTVVSGGPATRTAAPAPAAAPALPTASLEALLDTVQATPALRSFLIERVDSLSA